MKLSNTRTHNLFFATLLFIALLALFGPEEKSLGSNVRIVYLHGAWVMSAELALIAAGLTGLVGLISRRINWLRWSQAFGRSGIIFWVTYLPLSLWAMQANWNGLFLAEPRFRLALTFAIVGALLQVGLTLLENLWMTAAANVIFIIVLRVAFSTAADVMHPPPSPIFNSGLWHIIAFFVLLNVLALSAAFLLARALLAQTPPSANTEKIL